MICNRCHSLFMNMNVNSIVGTFPLFILFVINFVGFFQFLLELASIQFIAQRLKITSIIWIRVVKRFQLTKMSIVTQCNCRIGTMKSCSKGALLVQKRNDQLIVLSITLLTVIDLHPGKLIHFKIFWKKKTISERRKSLITIYSRWSLVLYAV